MRAEFFESNLTVLFQGEYHEILAGNRGRVRKGGFLRKIFMANVRDAMNVCIALHQYIRHKVKVIHLVPIDFSYMTSYWFSIVTFALGRSDAPFSYNTFRNPYR